MEYRRIFLTGGTFFFTIVTYKRHPILSDPENIQLLRKAFRYTLDRHPFSIVASVILPDHMHFIWTMPEDDSDYSTRWRLIKSYFTRNLHGKRITSEITSRQQKGEADVWQRRFWEHFIRDEDDLNKHVEYIHYNPVKHGLVNAPAEWKNSSFLKYVQDGNYALDWGGDEKILAGERWME
jgi:putative transposase